MLNTDESPSLLIDLVSNAEPAGLFLQLGVIVLIMLLAWWINGRIQKSLSGAPQHLAIRGGRRIAYPVLMLAGVLLARGVFKYFGASVSLLKLAIPLFLSLAFIRLLVYVLRMVFPDSVKLRTWERSISVIAWLAVVLHVSGLLSPVLAGMEELSFNFGHQPVSLLTILQGLFSVCATVLAALWLSRFMEERIMRMEEVDASSRVLLTKVTRGVLLVLSVLVALSLVGIDIRVLSVFGGALGVGLGFGLQRIASNYICGFIILLDKSIRLGDVVTLDNRYGTVTRLTGRYMVLSGQDGAESLIPNESVITQTLINHSYSNRKNKVKLSLQVSYDSPLEVAMQILRDAGQAHKGVIDEPPPSVNLLEFGDNGILLELSVWIEDPELTQTVLRSELNLAIWRAFAQAGIEIPYPQREIRIVNSA